MTKLAYLDCPTGIAGDMCLGALVHAGVPLEYLIEQLSRLSISNEYKLWAKLVQRNGQQATKVYVDLLTDTPPEDFDPDAAHSFDPTKPHPHSHADHSHNSSEHQHPIAAGHPPTTKASPSSHSHHSSHTHPIRHLPEIERLITTAKLPERAEAWSLAIFRQLAQAEGAVHGIEPNQVHFHEVGATDALVDIVGTCLGLDWLGIDRLYCAALPIGGGTIWAAHGRLPVPAPAVLKLWEMRQVPVYSNGIDRELVTPTGAAIVTTLATAFGSPPPMILHKVGLGAGSREFPIPNILRLWLGEEQEPLQTQKTQFSPSPIPNPQSLIPDPQFLETVSVLETQIDDLNPQAIGYVFEALFAVGALDVFTQSIGMKKSRPGILLTVICPMERVADCEKVLFRETTTLGVRRSDQQRRILHREFESVETSWGSVRVKIAREQPNGTILNVQPEYEDCVKLAQRYNLPWREVHRLVLQSWYERSE